ncbi:MAG: prephenate dehydrogenase [Candidatus Methylacidiphilales bacterium]
MAASRSITILGPGLLGGSLALALQQLPHPPTITVWARRTEAIEKVRSQGLAATTDLLAAVRSANEIIFCTPMGAMPDLAQTIVPHLQPDTFITDIASVKAPIESALGPIFQGKARWIGSHPMAGGEKAGFDAARADLFQNARVILTPTPATAPATLAQARAFWTDLGCFCLTTDPETHDRAVAQISHLPHLLAALLVNAVDPNALEFRGPGFLDTTRIAAGPAPMWAEILVQNRAAVLTALDQFHQATHHTRAALERGDEKELQEILTAANHVRRSLSAPA